MRMLRTSVLPPRKGSPTSANMSMAMHISAKTRVRATSSRNMASTGEEAVRPMVPGTLALPASRRARIWTVSALPIGTLGGAGPSIAGGGLGEMAVGAPPGAGSNGASVPIARAGSGASTGGASGSPMRPDSERRTAPREPS